MARITELRARQILDSRGNPTVEADVLLDDGTMGRAAIPSGASTGSLEAHELRDGDPKMFGGKSVRAVVANIEGEIADALLGEDAGEQSRIDARLVELDGTANKERLGANALLAVSLAIAKAEALSRGQFLFEHITSLSRVRRAPVLPVPLANLINGGKHAAGSTDFQEFMVMPIGAPTFSEALRMTGEIFHALRSLLNEEGYATTVGDEGGFAPAVKGGNREALELLMRAVANAGYTPGRDTMFAIDAAATEFYDGEQYTLASEDRSLSRDEMVDLYASLSGEFPLASIEDGLMESDWVGWHELYERLGDHVQLVGDDLLVTNVALLTRAIEDKSANAILVKPNQIGTLTETIDAVDTAHEAGFRAVISHRSGETEDSTISHLAVGLGTGQIKCGSVSRGERTAKYNELLRIEELLGEQAHYAGVNALA